MKSPRVCLSAFLALSLSACATIDDAGHGRAVRDLLASQHIDPGATERHASRAVPTDGRNTRDAMLRQADSFKSPPQSAIGGSKN